MKRCSWLNLKNKTYVRYHDTEWGKPVFDDQKLYESLILECFQAGLSFECVLNKREAFRKAYDGFDIDSVCAYSEEKIAELMLDPDIIRNKLKIKASIQNSRIFKKIQSEFGSFGSYLWGFTQHQIVYESYDKRTTSPLSDQISKDLKKRGMSFMGSTTVYAYLQAVGVINAHGKECDLYAKNKDALQSTCESSVTHEP